jgi:hypothetical protein|tara:strand:+ start:337 stop:513 length:177 start_codon:yes stop_codon:yes gene_type:complete
MKIITIQGDRYAVIGSVSVNTNYSSEELKIQWNADTVLRNGNKLYMTKKLIIAEFEDI